MSNSPTFQKHHYEVIAKVIQDTHHLVKKSDMPLSVYVGIWATRYLLIETFKKDNPNFNEKIFLEACDNYNKY